MPQNTGEPFFHPVTHTLITTGAWYEGAAHLEHENMETTSELDAQEAEPTPKAKIVTSKSTSKVGNKGSEES